MRNFRVFDNGGITLDRYTLFPYLESRDLNERVMFLGLSEEGCGFSQWGEVRCQDTNNLSFLGREMAFCELSEASQRHVLSRV